MTQNNRKRSFDTMEEKIFNPMETRAQYVDKMLTAMAVQQKTECNELNVALMMFPYILVSCFETSTKKTNDEKFNDFVKGLNSLPKRRESIIISLRGMICSDISFNIKELVGKYTELISDKNVSVDNSPIVKDENNKMSISFLITKSASFPKDSILSIKDILSLPVDIEDLTMNRMPLLNLESCQHIAKMPLKYIDFSEQEINSIHSLSVRTIINFIGGKELKKLHVAQCYIKRFPSNFIFSSITDLNISGLDLPLTQLEVIFTAPRIFKKLNISGNRLSDDVLFGSIVKCGQDVTELNLGFTQIECRHIFMLIGMKKIETLDLSYNSIYPVLFAVTKLTYLPRLTELKINGWHIIETHFLVLSRIPTLRNIVANFCPGLNKVGLMIMLEQDSGTRAMYNHDPKQTFRYQQMTIECTYNSWFDSNDITTFQVKAIVYHYARRLNESHIMGLFKPLLKFFSTSQLLFSIHDEAQLDNVILEGIRYFIEKKPYDSEKKVRTILKKPC